MAFKIEVFEDKATNKEIEYVALTSDDGRGKPFSFGWGKAKLIVQHIEDIKNFVTSRTRNKHG